MTNNKTNGGSTGGRNYREESSPGSRPASSSLAAAVQQTHKKSTPSPPPPQAKGSPSSTSKPTPKNPPTNKQSKQQKLNNQSSRSSTKKKVAFQTNQRSHSSPGANHFEDVQLYNVQGEGKTDFEKSIVRRSVDQFLARRLDYLEEPTIEWNKHDRWSWSSPDRISIIQQSMANYKPLEVNDETRWKARVMMSSTTTDSSDAGEESPEERIKKATAILNKLSWTTIDKLTEYFLAAISSGDGVISKQMIKESMQLVVDKAMQEPHFAEMYARFTGKLALTHKAFKKTLLNICRSEFDTSDQDPILPDDMPKPERDLSLLISRKKAVGLMQFIGELYKLQMIKGEIMIGCLRRLLVHDDEERLECFTKLMTTVGDMLHSREDEPELHELWDHIYSMSGKGRDIGHRAPSSRIKFLLQDLVDLKESGWVQKRTEDKAKTVHEIHQEVAREEAMAKMPQKFYRTQSSTFSQSSTASSASANWNTPRKSPKGESSVLGSGGGDGISSPKIDSKSSLQAAVSAKAPKTAQTPSKSFLDPIKCGDKMKNILKEYFVGGDTDEAVLCVSELVGSENEEEAGRISRGTAMVQDGILLVMEMKEEHVDKLLTVLIRCYEERTLHASSFVEGLQEPLEFLRDIEIDAPAATMLLAKIIARFIYSSILELSVLLAAPKYFLSDGRPADFARDILLARISTEAVSPIGEKDIEVLGKLLPGKTPDEIRQFISEK